MEKQNDHKKFSKKIWVLSAGIIVILAIVLFAGIKNGFFLRKGDKILYAAYHTIKDQPETADVSKDEDYTVSMDGQWKEQKIQAEYASVSDQKQLKGTIDLDKLPDLEFVMTLDEKELKNKSGLLVAHGETVRAAAYEKLGLKGETACFQVIYTSKSLRSLKGELNFRIPDRAEIERIKSEYHLESPENIEMLCSERKIWCGFLKSGEFVGFIGRHPEGSMGLLQVFSEYRRQGYGEELESFMINRFLEEGRVPYAHIIVDNEKSMNLQKKLGYEVADKKIYWLFEK